MKANKELIDVNLKEVNAEIDTIVAGSVKTDRRAFHPGKVRFNKGEGHRQVKYSDSVVRMVRAMGEIMPTSHVFKLLDGKVSEASIRNYLNMRATVRTCESAQPTPEDRAEAKYFYETVGLPKLKERQDALQAIAHNEKKEIIRKGREEKKSYQERSKRIKEHSELIKAQQAKSKATGDMLDNYAERRLAEKRAKANYAP